MKKSWTCYYCYKSDNFFSSGDKKVCQHCGLFLCFTCENVYGILSQDIEVLRNSHKECNAAVNLL